MLDPVRVTHCASEAPSLKICHVVTGGQEDCVGVEDNKRLVRRLVEEALGEHDLEVLDEIAAGPFAEVARRWVAPFRGAFPDFTMEIVELIAEGDKVVGHFTCSGTHDGEWLGVSPTGLRFEKVDEVYIFEVRDGRLVAALGVEDNLSRLRQLGIFPGRG
jgi:predicted ester cyclase